MSAGFSWRCSASSGCPDGPEPSLPGVSAGAFWLCSVLASLALEEVLAPGCWALGNGGTYGGAYCPPIKFMFEGPPTFGISGLVSTAELRSVAMEGLRA